MFEQLYKVCVVVCTMSDLSSHVPGLDEYSSNAELANVTLFKDYDDSLLVFASTACIIFMLIGIPGNFITILALGRYKKVRNATAIFIMNLSLSDLLFGCFNLPLAESTFWSRSWTHGKLLCRMFPMARYGLIAVSIFTVLAITISRYVMISHPVLYPKIYKKDYIALMIASTWIVPFGLLIPTYTEHWGRFSLHPTTGSCTIVPDKDGGNPKQFFFIIALALPSLFIIICYARILWIVRKTTKQSRSPPMKLRPPKMEPTITEVPETSIPATDEVVKRRETKTQFNMPCFCPELSSTSDGTSQENVKKSAPQFEGTDSLSSDRAQRIRQSFVTTFRRSTAFIKPRLPTKKDQKLLAMIIAIITSFLLCHLPITLTKTIFNEFTSHPTANIAGYVMIYMTTCMNPIIYVVMSVEFRKAYKYLFTCR